MPLKTIVAAAALAGVLAFPATARAGTISFSVPFALGAGPEAMRFTGTVDDLFVESIPYVFPRFTGPGTLEQVEISFASQYTQDIFEMGAATAASPTGDASVNATVDGTLTVGLYDLLSPAASTRTLNLSALHESCFEHTIDGCETGRFIVDGYGGSLSLVGLLPLFQADSDSSFVFFPSMRISFHAICGVENECYINTGGVFWTGDLTVTYTTSDAPGDGDPGSGDPGPTAVPEPATLTLLGLGLAVAGLRARRNN